MDRLRELESKGVYLFHGSGSIVEEFEPKQAHTMINGQYTPDGEPAIFASPFLDYAIFVALINMNNCPRGFRFGTSYEDGELKFRATQETLDQVNESSRGYVYVFNRSDFVERNPDEWVSYRKLRPLERVEVSWLDFKHPVSGY